MNCPICKDIMKDGLVSLDKSLAEWLVFGFGRREQYFTSDDGKKVKVHKAGGSNRAFRCENCGCVVFAGDN